MKKKKNTPQMGYILGMNSIVLMDLSSHYIMVNHSNLYIVFGLYISWRTKNKTQNTARFQKPCDPIFFPSWTSYVVQIIIIIILIIIIKRNKTKKFTFGNEKCQIRLITFGWNNRV